MDSFPKDAAELLFRMDVSRRRRPALESQMVPPRDVFEVSVVQVWSEVLNVREIGIDDNFFELGGDSLQMTQIGSRLLELFGVEISFGDFFDTPSVRGIVGRLRGFEASESRSVGVSALAPSLPLSVRNEFSKDRTTLPSGSWQRNAVNIASVVIPTRSRPDALQRSLTGLLRNLRYYGHTPRIIIADQSTPGVAEQANQEAVRKALRDFPWNVLILGSKETGSILNDLVMAGFPPDVVGFALHGMPELGLSSVGASRNVLLLAAFGEAFISIDDDTECRFACPPEFQPIICFDTKSSDNADDPAGIWVYPDQDPLLSAVAFDDVDLVRMHQVLLGQEYSPFSDSEVGNKWSIATAEEAERQPSGNVLVTLNGLAGDCGWGTPSNYLFVGDESFSRLTVSESAYSSAITSRSMLRAVSKYKVTSRIDNLITAAFGADNRTTLPPFVPVGRGSDVIFGQMVSKVAPHCGFGHLPWAILHSPMERRRFWPGEILRSASSTDVKGMFCALLGAVPNTNGMPREAALRSIGHALVELSEEPVDEFQNTLIELRFTQSHGEAKRLTSRLNGFTSPTQATPWDRDVENYLRALRQAQHQPTGAIPAELLRGRNITEATLLAKKITHLYGSVLTMWPDIARFVASRSK